MLITAFSSPGYFFTLCVGKFGRRNFQLWGFLGMGVGFAALGALRYSAGLNATLAAQVTIFGVQKSFDAFGKPVKEFQVKTAFGGYLSVLSMVIMAVLFINELLYFLELDTKDVMRIDQNQDNKYLNISLDITFFEVFGCQQ